VTVTSSGGISLSTSGSGNAVGSLSYNTGTGALTQNMVNIGGGGGSTVNVLNFGYSYSAGYYTTTLQQLYPVTMNLYIGYVVSGGTTYYIDLPSVFNVNNIFGFQMTPIVHSTSYADTLGQYLQLVLIRNGNSQLLTVKFINSSTQNLSNIGCFVSFWTTVNYNNLFPN
jgi:hypothetical protein